MSRRQEQAWERFCRSHPDLRGACLALGLEYDERVPEEEILESARRMFLEAAPRVDLGAIILRCQRCDRRVDVIRVRAKGWRRSEGTWAVMEPEFSSRGGAEISGVAPLSYSCRCGRTDIRFSRRTRLQPAAEELAARLPEIVDGTLRDVEVSAEVIHG